MTKELFIQPRFVGPRFEQHTLPLSAAKDLAAYEELVLELAKHLFREKNAGRIRVPKGFGNGFSLHIERIDDGCARPALVAMMMGAVVNVLPVEIQDAKTLINKVIATEAGHSFPAEFPKDFYSYFNRIGCSLEKDEFIEWVPDSLVNKTVLTPTKRKRLVLAHRETYDAAVEVMGLVEGLQVQKKTGDLRMMNTEAVVFGFCDPFFGELKEALGKKRLHVRLKGIGVFDVNDRLDSVATIDQIELLPHYPLVLAIDGLSSLKDGWLEGHGVAPKSDDLNWLTNEVAKSFPESLEYPSVAPTEEGHVIFEWMRPHARIELEINFEEQQLELYSTNLTTAQFVEETFTVDQWEGAFSKIATLLLA